MREHPILFSGPMVRAILEGRKTQTRRVFKDQVSADCRGWFDNGDGTWNQMYYDTKIGRAWPKSWSHRCPYGSAGDRLWVREAWCHKIDDTTAQYVYNSDGNLDTTCVYYAADGVDVRAVDGGGFQRYNKDGSQSSPWVPSIHMPRWASRIELDVVCVRVERLNDITAGDADDEGVDATSCCRIEAFQRLWDSINSVRGYGWDSNPWVWVIEFTVAEVRT